MAKFLISVCLLLAIVHTGYSLKCYSCDSKNKKECGDPFVSEKVPLNECPKPTGNNADMQTSSCLKLVTEDNGETKVKRYCYVYPKGQEPCKHLNSPALNIKECVGCDNDGCNGSGIISVSTYVFMATCVMAIVNNFVRS